MYDGEMMDLYQTYLYYIHEIHYLNHRIDWSNLTSDQLDRIVDIVSKEKEALQKILDEQETTNVTLT